LIHILALFDPYLSLFWSIFEPYLIHIWSLINPYLIRSWSILEPYLIHIWSWINLYLIRSWSFFDPYLIHIWSFYKYVLLLLPINLESKDHVVTAMIRWSPGSSSGYYPCPLGSHGSYQVWSFLELSAYSRYVRRPNSAFSSILNSTHVCIPKIKSSLVCFKGIRSVFGSIRNYFSGRPTATTAPAGGSPLPPLPPSQSAPQFSSGGLEALHQVNIIS